MEIIQSNETQQPTTHDIMYRPYDIDDAAMLLAQPQEELPEVDYGSGTDNEDDRQHIRELAAQRRRELSSGRNPTRAGDAERVDRPNALESHQALLNRPYIPLPSLVLSESSRGDGTNPEDDESSRWLPIDEESIRQATIDRFNNKYSYRLSDVRDNAPKLTSNNNVAKKPSGIPHQVQNYVGNWRSTRPEFLEPVGNMKNLPVGSIPPPLLDRGT